MCFLLILFFGIAAYANTFNVPFQYDAASLLTEQTFQPPFNSGKIWNVLPSRFVAHTSFALQFAITGSAPWGFHVVNLLIHLLTTLAVFGTTRLLLRTPALRGTIPPEQHDVFSLASALLFLTHPLQTESVTYIVQRLTSLASLFYLATLWMYLKARLEDARHYRVVFLFMLAAMMSKEISFTIPFAILLVDFCFFPLSEKETVLAKLLRWLPFAAFLLGILLLFYLTSAGRFESSHAAVNTTTSRWCYLLTQFRVLRTYLRLLVFPVNQCVDYDYRLSSGRGDLDTWAAFYLLFNVFLLAIAFLKKYRLLAFGVLWFFLTLSVESTVIPLKDLIVEHRLYLPMFGFSLFFSSLLWQAARSPARFLAIVLALAVVLSGMTYARNEVWQSPFTLWRDTVKRSPHKWRPYSKLGEAYMSELNDDKTALFYFHKALETGGSSAGMLANMSTAYFRLKNPTAGTFYHDWANSIMDPRDQAAQVVLYGNEAVTLRNEKKIPEAITSLKKALAINSQYQRAPILILLGEFYRESGQEDAAIAAFRQAIEAAPASKEGYDALALLYKEKGENQKALAVIIEYLRFKQKHKQLFGN